MRSAVPSVLLCLTGFGQPIHQVGFEAGALMQPISFGLTEAGYDFVCKEARQVAAALSAMRDKTDKHDARGITQVLRSGWYSRVHVKSIESHHVRALLTSRKVMQRKCIDLENEIRSLLRIFGVVLPLRLSRGAFDVAVRETIETDHALLPMLEARAMLFETFTELDRRVKRAASVDAICRRSITVPSVRSPPSASRLPWMIRPASRIRGRSGLTLG